MTTFVIANDDGTMYLSIDAKHQAEFKAFIQRASNLAPDLSPVMKTLADYVTNGKAMQDYFATQTVAASDRQSRSEIFFINEHKDLK